MRQAVGADYPVWVKLNCADFMKDGSMTFEESKQVMTWLADMGVNAIEVSGGNTSSLPRKGPIRLSAAQRNRCISKPTLPQPQPC